MYQPSIPVRAVDSVGAGDSFNGAYAVSIAQKHTLKEALYQACVNGALATIGIGIVDAYPTREQVELAIREFLNS